MSVLRVKNGDQWDIVPAIKGDTGDPTAPESITDAMLVTDGIKTEIEWLWGNQLMDSREGEILHAEDAYTAPAVDISVDGKSTQVVTTGAQMLNDATSTRGYRTNPNGNPIAASSYSMSDYIPVDASTAYYFVNMVGSQNGYTLCEYDSEKVFIQYQTIYGTTSAVGTRTTSETTAYIIVSYATANAGTAMVSKGSTATAYEPYTGGKSSPRPDWPQEIVSIDEPALTLAGNNILDPSFLTQCGWTESNDQYTGTPRQLYQGLANHIVPVPCAPNTQYVFAWHQISTTNTGNNNALDFRFVYSDGTTGAAKYSDLNPVFASTSVEGKTVVGLRFSYVSYPTLVVECVQLVPLVTWSGSVEENYQPYIAPTTIPLLPDGYSLRSLPDGTKDELHLSYLRPSKREGWAWYSRELVKRVYELFINYVTNVSSNAGGPFARVYLSVSGINTTSAYENILCDRFKCGPASIQGDCLITSNGGVAIFSGAMFDTVENARAWMAENTPVLDYPLATPTTETLDPIELPIMPSRTINVWSDPATNLKMTYIQDTNLIIENLEAAVADAVTS